MRKTIRYVRLGLMLTVAILAAAIVSTLTVDVGSAAPRAGRALRVGLSEAAGCASARCASTSSRGHFLIEDFSIDGLQRGRPPVLHRRSGCRSRSTGRPLSTQPRRSPITSVELTDWQMLVEKWSSRPQLPEVHARSAGATAAEGPSRFTTTLKYLRAWRGQFAYEDHETPWSVVAPNIDLNITNLPTYHGEATFTRRHGGDPELPADVGEHEGAVRHRRQPACT